MYLVLGVYVRDCKFKRRTNKIESLVVRQKQPHNTTNNNNKKLHACDVVCTYICFI